MLFSGVQKTSLVDFPGGICDTLFLAGCNLRCPYCHNPELVTGSRGLGLREDEVLSLLESRRRLLDGVCVTGGEPTLQPAAELARFFARVKALGLMVKLDTNGTSPKALRQLIDAGLVDYVAMDVKAPPARYQEICRAPVDVNAIQRSVSILMRGEIDYEFRTTVPRSLLSEGDLVCIGEWLRGAKRYVLQRYRPERRLAPEFVSSEAGADGWLAEMKTRLQPYFQEVLVRGVELEAVISQ